jgi:hypothetical protein
MRSLYTNSSTDLHGLRTTRGYLVDENTSQEILENIEVVEDLKMVLEP